MMVVAVVQARMGSTRLPGKVLMDLAGASILERGFRRLSRARTLDKVVIATTVERADDALEAVCRTNGWPCARGNESDVLDRYYRAAVAYAADVVVRVTSDCPLIEPEIVDQVVTDLLQGEPRADYVSNTLPPRTFPRGLDVEAVRFDALERAWREDTDPTLREHVTPYIYRHPESFRLRAVTSDVDYSDQRWTVDTPEDLAFVRRIYEHIGHDRFSWRDVLSVLETHPDWLAINRDIVQKAV
jgi:spore coat polysaccharide biosynthesis protein SpsF